MSDTDTGQPETATVSDEQQESPPATTSQSVWRRTFSAFEVEHFGSLWASGWIWNIARWGAAFLGAYLVNDLTESPRLVQLTGTAMWAPLLAGGVVGGVISDRFDRRKTVMAQFLFIGPLSAVMGVLVLADVLEVWMVFVYMALIGIGWVADMTSRRALVFDLVGPANMNNAIALESLSMSGGIMLGTITGGAVIDQLGIGQAYLLIAAGCFGAFLLMLRIPSPPRMAPPAGRSFRRDLVEGFDVARQNRTLLSILGVTVAVNFFYFAYFPIVQRIADLLDTTPFLTGLLASATGMGMMAGSTIIATVQPARRGLWYVGGSAGAMVFIFGFAGFSVFWLVFVSLLLSSLCVGFFGATQSALVMDVADDEMRGRALGLLSMAIGSLPIGMYLLGELAEQVGAPTAIVIANIAGLLMLLAWQLWRPEATKVH